MRHPLRRLRGRVPRPLALAAGPWALGIVVLLLWAGPIAAVNPFEWLLSLKEFMEFLVWLPGNLGRLGMFIGAFPDPETVRIVAGALGVAGWAAAAAARL